MQTLRAGTSSSSPAESGFTLLELAVVVAIIAILLVIVVPRLPSTEEAKLRSSARQTASLFRYLQDQGIGTKASYRLHIKMGENTISVTKISEDGVEITPEDTFLQRQVLAEGISVADIQTQRTGMLTEGETAIAFGPAGIAEFVAIHLVTTKGKFFTIMAYPSSGKVKLWEDYREEPL